MTPIIYIPEPCHENWNAMQPADQGRHCNACCKTVIDFTTWEPGDIAGYLADPANKKTCGRFHKTRLEWSVPASPSEWTERIYHSSLSGVRKVAAVIIVVFSIMGISCQKPKMENAMEPVTQWEADIIMGALELPDLVLDTVMGERTDSIPVCSIDTVAERGMIKGRTAVRMEYRDH